MKAEVLQEASEGGELLKSESVEHAKRMEGKIWGSVSWSFLGSALWLWAWCDALPSVHSKKSQEVLSGFHLFEGYFAHFQSSFFLSL